jgi:hypothetical protein
MGLFHQHDGSHRFHAVPQITDTYIFILGMLVVIMIGNGNRYGIGL